jgi:uncharacterized protein
VYFPFLLKDEDGLAQGNDWAKGFMRGMGLRRDSWSELVNDEQHGDSLVPIFTLAYEHDPDQTRSVGTVRTLNLPLR